MRVHSLQLSAFLAFADVETVDFDALAEAGLFLLHGRTGAGKTAILDAICFAFYGELASGREAQTVRSDHATGEVRTEVVLEATLRGERVRITRSPKQERPKARGEGTTEDGHRVQVEAIGDDGTVRVLAATPDEARAELSRLLGMTREQFCQVVLLPQGGFARFLHARSDDREKLLRELFEVQRFSDVERWLKQQRDDAAAAARVAMEHVREQVVRVAQTADAKPPEGWDHEPGSAQAWLEEQRVVAEASATTADAVAAAAGRDAEAAADALVAGSRLASQQAEARAAQAALAGWEARRGLRDEAAAALMAGRAAAPARPVVEALDAREAAWGDALRAAKQAAEAARRAGGVALGEAARAEGDDGEPDFASAGWLARESARLRGLAARLGSDAGAAGALAQTEQAVTGAEREIATLDASARAEASAAAAKERAVADAAPVIAGRQADVTAAQAAAARLEGLATAARAAAGRRDAARERDRLVAAHEATRSRAVAAREAALHARERSVALRERRLSGIAAELASGLVTGEACAVCGSASHPSPATPPDGGLVDPTALEAAETDAETRAAASEQATQAMAELGEALSAAKAVAGEQSFADAETAAEVAAAGLAAAERVAGGADAAATALATAIGLRDAAEREAKAHGVAAAKAAEARDARRKELAGDRAAVEAARGGAPSVAERVAALTTAGDAASAAATALDAAAGAARELEAARAAAVRAAAQLDAARAGAGSDPDDPSPAARIAVLRAALAEPGRLDELEARIRRYDAGLTERAAATRREELVTAAAAAAPDVPALERAAHEAKAAATRAEQSRALTSRRREQLDGLRDTLADALAEAAPARERAAVVREIADLALGTAASNRLKIRLTAYVLAARLEQVAEAATTRLQAMSGGRYALLHSDAAARANSRGGLELRVADAWTGRERAPASLSGGETFLASLALALGLADVVAAEAGGARLETLFVDEGFGSLDDEGTLDAVLEVLDGLRDGGRTVGVVSHVAELRQRIPAQLRVEKGRSGSHVEQGVALAG